MHSYTLACIYARTTVHGAKAAFPSSLIEPVLQDADLLRDGLAIAQLAISVGRSRKEHLVQRRTRKGKASEG